MDVIIGNHIEDVGKRARCTDRYDGRSSEGAAVLEEKGNMMKQDNMIENENNDCSALVAQIRQILSQPVSRRQFAVLASATAVAATAASMAPQAKPRAAYAGTGNTIAILHTNDVHCEINPNEKKGYVGYAGVATLFKQAKEAYGADNALLVDAGDCLQGQTVGSVTKGKGIVEIMNALGYSYACIGNHDFDFGLEALFELAGIVNHHSLCCNVSVSGESKSILPGYSIDTYCGKKLAFVGITTPETLVKSRPKTFQDDDGNYIFDFKQDNTGKKLYDCVQQNVDEARLAGADYVIALAHLGNIGITDRWSSEAVIQNTTGIDTVIDGHSHEHYVKTVKNKIGNDVVLTQTGTQLASVGRILVNVDTNEITAELVGAPIAEDPTVKAVVDKINAEVAKETGKVIAHTNFELVGVKDGELTKVSRFRETNLGDMAADAYRVRLDTDICLCGGGSIRDDIAAGDITMGDLLAVAPFFNKCAIIKAKGSTILDALEMGARMYPEPLGGFLQVSGMSYEIRSDIPSSVVLDEASNFVSVGDTRRVQNVRVAGQPIDKDAVYTIGGLDFLLISGGDGYSMLKQCEVVMAEGNLDVEVLKDYVVENMHAEVSDEYRNKLGQGRIVVKDGPDPIVPGEVPDTGDAKSSVTVVAAGVLAAASAAVAAMAASNSATAGAGGPMDE